MGVHTQNADLCNFIGLPNNIHLMTQSLFMMTTTSLNFLLRCFLYRYMTAVAACRRFDK
jgi:hypothetical protein